MAEDAAAAARRIVEEVLARRGSSSDDVDADAGAGMDPKGTDAAPEHTGAPQEPPEPAGEAEASEVAGEEPDLSEAARIARRIVDDVLTTVADAPVTGRGGARDALPAEDERTARIAGEEETTATRRLRGADGDAAAAPAGQEASAPRPDAVPGEPTGVADTPADDPPTGSADTPANDPPTDSADAPAASTADSAESIVRRIVADVQAEAAPTGTEEGAGVGQDTAHLPTTATVSEPPMAGPSATEASAPPTTPVADDPVEPPDDLYPPEDVVDPPEDVVDPPEDVVDPPGDEAAVTRGVPRSGEHAGPSMRAGVELAVADEEHGEDRAAPGFRSLVGWAAPPEPEPEPVPEPLAAPEVGEPPSRTLRWFLASLLGAVALAVLFPLAVAALRALVSLG